MKKNLLYGLAALVLAVFSLPLSAQSGDLISWSAAETKAAGPYTSATNPNFKLTLDNAKGKLVIDANKATFEGGHEFTFRLKTGGKSQTGNGMTLSIPAAGTLKVYARTGSNSATDRNVVLTQSGKEIANHILLDSEAVNKVYPAVSAAVVAGDVAVTYPINSINIYGFEFIAGETKADTTKTDTTTTDTTKTDTTKVDPQPYEPTPSTGGTKWDFTTISDADYAAISADATNWTKDASKNRYATKQDLTKAALTAGGKELALTKGLLFTGKAGKFRINKDEQRLEMNGKGISIDIPVKKGDKITVTAKSGNTTDAPNRYLTITNATVVSEFAKTATGYADWTANVATATADGYATITANGGGINLQSIIVGEVKTDTTKTDTTQTEPTKKEKLAAPTVIGDKTFKESVTVTITAAEGATVNYATDGKTFKAYSEPITLTETTTISAFASQEGKENSDTIAVTFTKEAASDTTVTDTTGTDPTPVQSGDVISWVGTEDITTTTFASPTNPDFTLTITDPNNRHSIDANSQYFGTATSYRSFGARLKSGGKSQDIYYMTLNIPDDGTLKVYARSANAQETTRTVVLNQNNADLYNAVVKDADAVEATIEGVAKKVFPVISVPVKKGTVKVGYPNGAINFYAFEFISSNQPVTGISTIKTNVEKFGDGAWYTIQGVKLQSVDGMKGIFIHNGKKYILK